MPAVGGSGTWFQAFAVLSANRTFVFTMAAGSIAGTYLGSRLLAAAPASLLIPILAVILVVSAIKVWQHA
jgi:uncharacterized membrane protein YfcA